MHFLLLGLKNYEKILNLNVHVVANQGPHWQKIKQSQTIGCNHSFVVNSYLYLRYLRCIMYMSHMHNLIYIIQLQVPICDKRMVATYRLGLLSFLGIRSLIINFSHIWNLTGYNKILFFVSNLKKFYFSKLLKFFRMKI